MRNVLRSSALVAGAFLATALGLAQTAQANQIELMSDLTRYTGDANSINVPGSGADNGGEFGVRASNFVGLSPPPMAAGVAGPQSLFQTFCLERDENVTAPSNAAQDVDTRGGIHPVYDWSVDTKAIRGGVNTHNGDPISAQTAYLYYNFWYKTLATYNYTFGAGRKQSANDLQLAIWYFENEAGTAANGYNPPFPGSPGEFSPGAIAFINMANLAVDGAVAGSGSGSWGNTIANVRVLNLFYMDVSGAVQAQSVLVLVPLPPAAWLGLGLMTAMGAVGIIRRRKQQALV